MQPTSSLPIAEQWATTVHTLPSGRQVRLRRIDPQEFVGLVDGLPTDPGAAAEVLAADPERLLQGVAQLLDRGVVEPRIVARAHAHELRPGEIRYQDIGSDLSDLIMAIMSWSEIPVPEMPAQTEV